MSATISSLSFGKGKTRSSSGCSSEIQSSDYKEYSLAKILNEQLQAHTCTLRSYTQKKNILLPHRTHSSPQRRLYRNIATANSVQSIQHNFIFQHQFHHHLVSNISFLSHNLIIHAFANIDLTITEFSILFTHSFFRLSKSFFALFLPTHPKIPFHPFFLLSTFICGHVVPRPASRFETCAPGHAWDPTIHDTCFFSNRDKVEKTDIGHSLWSWHSSFTVPGICHSPNISHNLLFPIPFSSRFFFSIPHTTPVHSIHSLKSR